MRGPLGEWIGAGVPPGLQSRLGFVNSGAGGFDSHALPPSLPTVLEASPGSSGLTIRPYEPGDEHAIVAAFNRIFGEVDPGFVPRTLEYWRWQFLGNPAGHVTWLAVAEDGRIACQYTGLLQDVLIEGRPAVIMQVVDSMNDPAYRRTLTGGRLFASIAASFLETNEAPRGSVCFYWGLPIPRAWRVGKRAIRYDIVRTQLELRAAPEELSLAPAPGVEVETVEAFPEDTGELFRRAAAPHGVIAVRDERTLDWRFVDHPDRRYVVATARKQGTLVGYAVYRAGEFGGDFGGGLVCDWLVDPAHPEADDALLAWLADRAREDGADELLGFFPETCREWAAFQRAGFVARASRYFMGVRPTPVCSLRWLYWHWYYTLGESDLV